MMGSKKTRSSSSVIYRESDEEPLSNKEKSNKEKHNKGRGDNT
jgi:hypothetical protein